LEPTKIDNARQETFNLIASSIDVVIVSFDKSSPTILVAPDTLRTIGTLVLGFTDVRKTHLVSISESANDSSGFIVI
jgi:hypothetical protein